MYECAETRTERPRFLCDLYRLDRNLKRNVRLGALCRCLENDRRRGSIGKELRPGVSPRLVFRHGYSHHVLPTLFDELLLANAEGRCLPKVKRLGIPPYDAVSLLS